VLDIDARRQRLAVGGVNNLTPQRRRAIRREQGAGGNERGGNNQGVKEALKVADRVGQADSVLPLGLHGIFAPNPR